MKIKNTQDNMMKAWLVATQALDTIAETILDNRECSRQEINAYYTLLTATNNWHDEIKNRKTWEE